MNKEIVIYDYTIRFGNKILYDVEEDIIKLIRLLQQENKELHNKIDKAIEYIKNKHVIDLDYLEEILKDSDVDE